MIIPKSKLEKLQDIVLRVEETKAKYKNESIIKDITWLVMELSTAWVQVQKSVILDTPISHPPAPDGPEMRIVKDGKQIKK